MTGNLRDALTECRAAAACGTRVESIDDHLLEVTLLAKLGDLDMAMDRLRNVISSLPTDTDQNTTVLLLEPLDMLTEALRRVDREAEGATLERFAAASLPALRQFDARLRNSRR